MNLTFRVPKIEESYQLLKFLRIHFYPEEPISVGIEPKQPAPEDEQYTISNIKYGTSLVAEYKNTIVGVLIAGPITPNYVNSLIVESKNSTDYKWKHIAKLLATVQTNANIFTRYNINKALYVHACAVDREHRGKSIGQQLLEHIIELGRSFNYTMLSVDCTGYYSIKMAINLEMEFVSTIKYSDYKDENGLEIFRVPHPHSEIQTFVKKL